MLNYLLINLLFINVCNSNIIIQTTSDNNITVDDYHKNKNYNSYNSYIPEKNHIIEKNNIYVVVAIVLFSFLAVIISFFSGYYIYLDYKYKKYKNINREPSNPDLIPGGLPLYDEL